MNIMSNKKSMRLAILSLVFVLFGIVAFDASAQQLKPTEIIYSRLQTNLFAAPTGTNQPTIWAVGQDGSNDRQITTGTQPRISDDGRFLLFKRFDGNSSNPYGNPFLFYARIWLRNLQTGTETLLLSLTTDTQVGYSFSPESNRADNQIFFIVNGSIYKMNLDGTNITIVNPGHPFEYFPILRRGDSLIASSTTAGCNFGTPGCKLITTTLDSQQQIIPNTGVGDNSPAWSNDNQYIGFATMDTTRGFSSNPFGYDPWYPYFFRSIGKVKSDGSTRTQIFEMIANSSNANGIAFGLVWTNDNSKIIFAARINGVAGLYSVNTDGSGTPTRIPISNGNAPDWVGGIVQPRTDAQLVSNGGGLITDQNGNFPVKEDGSPDQPSLQFVNQFSMTTSVAEPLAGGAVSGGQFSFQSGFVPNAPPITTAALAALGGRVMIGERGLAKIRVTVVDSQGNSRTMLTNPFGYYRFEELRIGETYIVSVGAKENGQFPPQVINLNGEMTNVNFSVP